MPPAEVLPFGRIIERLKPSAESMSRILVVDDTEAILLLVRGVAQRLGLEVATLSSTVHFMTTFVRFQPDTVVLDMVMPDMDGIEIIQWLCDVNYRGRLVIMSGYADYDRMGKVLSQAEGRMQVSSLPKPFRLAALKAMLSGEADREIQPV
jgi:DNA-binding NtrC family response regulator